LARIIVSENFGELKVVDKTKQTSIKADFVLDAVGKKCPMPILEVRDSIDELKVGQTVELIADDIGAKTDVPAFCRRAGHELVKTWEEKGALHFLIKKGK
jgi:tRNA 2-thiouridine synthesizing protein A